MKYYYGNDAKEALSHEPIEIETTDVLAQYEECYNVVIPAEIDIDDDEEE